MNKHATLAVLANLKLAEEERILALKAEREREKIPWGIYTVERSAITGRFIALRSQIWDLYNEGGGSFLDLI